MCEECFDCYGRPEPTVAALAVVPLVAAVYDDHAAGGGLHIVVDDWNIEDVHIEWCLRKDDITPAERACADALLALPEEQRAACLAVYDGIIPAPQETTNDR